MGWGIRSVVSVSVLVAAAGLGPVVLAEDAAAAVACVHEFVAEDAEQQPGSAVLRFPVRAGLELPPDALVADVDVSVVAEVSAPTTLSLERDGVGPFFSMVRSPLMLPQRLDITYDDEAYATRGSDQWFGRVRPDGEPLSMLDRRPVAEPGVEWVLRMAQDGGSGPVRLSRGRLTVTLASCDSDGDGVEEQADNCPTVANADQADWDADRTGNACDATPGSPAPPSSPAPPPGPTPGSSPAPPSTSPGTPLPSCTQGACRYDRTVAMRLDGDRLVGRIVSPVVGCRVGTAVTVWRVRPGEDRSVAVVRTRDSARFRARAPRRPGRFYATVGSAAETLCAADRSPAVRVRRR